MKDWAIRLLSFALATAVVFGGLWWASRSLTQAPPKPGADTAAGATANPGSAGKVNVGPAVGLSPPSTGLYRCETPQSVEYRNSPCPTGKQAAVDVVIPQGYDSRPVYNPAFQRPVQRAPEVAASPQQRFSVPAPTLNQSCAELDARIAEVNAAARAGGTADEMNRLRELWHKLNAKKSAAGCR